MINQNELTEHTENPNLTHSVASNFRFGSFMKHTRLGLPSQNSNNFHLLTDIDNQKRSDGYQKICQPLEQMKSFKFPTHLHLNNSAPERKFCVKPSILEALMFQNQIQISDLNELNKKYFKTKTTLNKFVFKTIYS